jgi:hypothetical protein
MSLDRIPWGPIRSSLATNFSFGDIKEIVGYANLNMSQLAHLEQKSKDSATKSQLLSAIDKQVGGMDADQLGKVAAICCEEMLRKKSAILGDLDRVLARAGWKFANNTLLPLDILDLSELKDIPEKAHDDIVKAGSRLRDGDLSGALSASCGAIDAVTASIYREFGLGDPDKASFQERVKKSVDAIRVKEKLVSELQAIGWRDSDFKPLSNNLEGALNQAAYIMQKLRSDMGDVHGTKPVITALVYDVIKWSLLLLRIMGERDRF